MKIPETIKKAIEGGYDNQNARYIALGLESQTHCNYSDIFLDPNFWQSLGKAMEWGEVCINCHNSASSCCEEKYNQDWKYFWHNFIDALASGKTAEGFFKELK